MSTQEKEIEGKGEREKKMRKRDSE